MTPEPGPPTARTLADQPGSWPVRQSAVRYRATVVDVREDEIEAPDGSRHRRDVVEHRGAVAVVAIDEQDRVLVLHQYRHPVAATLVELPAGLLDVPDEDPVEAARRELAEEALLAAERWSPLVEVATSPGISDERVQIYLAEQLSEVPVPDGFVPHGEEASMVAGWAPLDELVAAIVNRRVADGLLIAGILTLYARRTATPHRSR
jgi:ADP-ribose pyrophosphatase